MVAGYRAFSWWPVYRAWRAASPNRANNLPNRWWLSLTANNRQSKRSPITPRRKRKTPQMPNRTGKDLPSFHHTKPYLLRTPILSPRKTYLVLLTQIPTYANPKSGEPKKDSPLPRPNSRVRFPAKAKSDGPGGGDADGAEGEPQLREQNQLENMLRDLRKPSDRRGAGDGSIRKSEPNDAKMKEVAPKSGEDPKKKEDKAPQVWHRDQKRPTVARVYVGNQNSLELVSLQVSVKIEGPRPNDYRSHLPQSPCPAVGRDFRISAAHRRSTQLLCHVPRADTRDRSAALCSPRRECTLAGKCPGQLETFGVGKPRQHQRLGPIAGSSRCLETKSPGNLRRHRSG